MTYAQGIEDAKADWAANLFPKATRGYPKAYRDGYSDGYWKCEGAKKL